MLCFVLVFYLGVKPWSVQNLHPCKTKPNFSYFVYMICIVLFVFLFFTCFIPLLIYLFILNFPWFSKSTHGFTNLHMVLNFPWFSKSTHGFTNLHMVLNFPWFSQIYPWFWIFHGFPKSTHGFEFPIYSIYIYSHFGISLHLPFSTLDYFILLHYGMDYFIIFIWIQDYYFILFVCMLRFFFLFYSSFQANFSILL